MTPEENEALINKVTSNSRYWYDDRAPVSSSQGRIEVDEATALRAQIEALNVKIKNLEKNQVPPFRGSVNSVSYNSYAPHSQSSELVLSCENCMGSHLTSTCPYDDFNSHDVNLMEYAQIANQEHASCNLVNAIDALDDFWFGTSSVEDGPREEGIISMANSAEEKYVELMELCDKALQEEENAEQVLGVQAEEDEEEENEPEPTPELKPLPSHLEYAFLDEEEKCPVIIASDLTEEQKGKLIDLLKLYGHVIARKLEDLKGISPTFCTHKIFIEEGKRPMAQQPRRLNPNLRKMAEEDYEEEALNVTLPAAFEMHLPSGEPRKHFRTWGRKRTLLGPLSLDQVTLEEWSHWEEIDGLLADSRWRYLLTFAEQSSLELTIEFLCTYECLHGGRPIKDAADVRPDSTLKFSLSGRAFTLSIAEFGRHLGIYTEEEARSLVFAALPYSLPSEFSLEQFWRQHSLSTTPFNKNTAHTCQWRSSAWRILCFVLSHGLFGRPTNSNRIGMKDIYFFWSVAERVQVNLAIFMAQFFLLQGKSQRKTLQAGPFVTRLARSLLPQMPGNLLPIDQSIRPLSTTTLTKMGIAKRRRVEETDEPTLDFFDGLDTTVHSPIPDATTETFMAGGSSFVQPGTYTASSSGADPTMLQKILEEMMKMNTRMGAIETSIQDVKDIMETDHSAHVKQMKRMNERLESHTQKLHELEMMLGKKSAPPAPSSRASHQ
ncbi:unnamed protein product [Cuscuta campestris]|uniref:Uncharacterized protein n=1 Tax=Cuscuta campestris TaxID=132261 RepID=A0A484MEH9_9ASTE|nr:unnamed protein product [Cuscuta campestris]